MNAISRILYYIKQTPHIVEWIVKKGLFGKKKQIRYYIGHDKVKEKKKPEWDAEFNRIRDKYVGIRVWRNNCGSRIGEFIPRVRMVVRYHNEHADGWLDVIYDPNYDKNNHALVSVLNRSIPIIHEGNISKWTYILYLMGNVNYAYYNMLSSKCWDKHIYQSRDYRYLFELNAEELREAKGLLVHMGISDSDEYVCFANRDRAFLNTVDPLMDWSYHDYRNTTIQNYDMMIEYLKRLGVKAVRIGKYPEIRYICEGSIDYASDYYSELLDIYLPQKAAFCIVPCGGVNDLPLSLNDNVIVVNVVPQLCKSGAAVPITKNTIYIFKKLYSKQKERFLTLAETAEADVAANENGLKYSEMELVYVENSAEEILSVAIEMRERILGTWKETPEDKKRQEIFQEFKNAINLKYGIPDAHAYFHRVGSRFLENNWDWMGL